MGQNILVIIMAALAFAVGIGAWINEIRDNRDNKSKDPSETWEESVEKKDLAKKKENANRQQH
ncbi:MAG: hypothetical protein IJ648_05620 [Lachnospiraceae bacterium]|nr:hypothetical protein [Lachnospiraceae bacterium]